MSAEAAEKPVLRTEDFDFDLPAELIAQHPVTPRDAARLLVVGPTLEDKAVRDLPDLLRDGDLLVVNDTQVLPTRLVGRRGTAKIEVTLHKPEGPGLWRAFARPARKVSAGDEILFASDFASQVRSKGEAGEIVLDFACDDGALLAQLRTTETRKLMAQFGDRVAAGELAPARAAQTFLAELAGGSS